MFVKKFKKFGFKNECLGKEMMQSKSLTVFIPK